MNELQNKDMRTPIEIALDIDSDNMTTAKKLYAFLGLSPSNYSKWCKNNITDNEFAEENVDYWAFVLNDEWGGQSTTDYKLTAHFAKKLTVKGNSARAEEAREYFTALEEKVKQKVIDHSQLSLQLQLSFGILETQAKQELEQKRLAEEQKKITEEQNKQKEKLALIEQNQTAISETFGKVSSIEEYQSWVNSCITKIAESPKFDKGFDRKTKYSLARAESYERLSKKRNCRLDDRVQRAIGRAIEERPDIKKSELQKINKLYVIANDKDLRSAYELVIKEMMMQYCVSAE